MACPCGGMGAERRLGLRLGCGLWVWRFGAPRLGVWLGLGLAGGPRGFPRGLAAGLRWLQRPCGCSSRRQAPGADHVVCQGVPEGDAAHLVKGAHDELPQPAIAGLGIGAFRGCGTLFVDRLGRCAAHALAPSAIAGGSSARGAFASRVLSRGVGTGT